jgi:hypothetical protein
MKYQAIIKQNSFLDIHDSLEAAHDDLINSGYACDSFVDKENHYHCAKQDIVIVKLPD